MKIIDEIETQKKTKQKKKQKKQRQNRTTGAEAIVKGSELNHFVAYLS